MNQEKKGKPVGELHTNHGFPFFLCCFIENIYVIAYCLLNLSHFCFMSTTYQFMYFLSSIHAYTVSYAHLSRFSMKLFCHFYHLYT